MGFLGNIPGLEDVIGRRLSQDERSQRRPIEGALTRPSQEYPDELVDTILSFMKKIIHRLEPHRFALHHVLPVAQPVADLTEWDDVEQHVSKTFERANKRPFNIDPSSDLGKKICDLARMNAVRIQCAYTPTTRRIPTALAFDSEVTSRAALLEYANGRRVLEVDNILELQLPKQRFDTPVAVAIFMYGTLREEPPTRPTATDEDAKLPLADLPTDITFPGLPSGHGINVDTRRTVARLHLNLGHPSPQELIRMVAYYGGAPSTIITCIQHLKCSTCDRLKSPQQPRPATMPKFIAGQFGDEVQGDLFYVRLLTGDAIPVLGLVDKATGYHQAAVCTTRNSAETFEIFVKCWFKPFGLPYKMMLDPDTAFRGDCQRQIESLGIICDFCPAEAHWMIGMVERRNSILRCILEKLIDQHASSTTDELELLLAPALHAVNSSTFTRGRTAFQAVFGRVPRLPGGLLTDETSLASSHGAWPTGQFVSKGRDHSVRSPEVPHGLEHQPAVETSHPQTHSEHQVRWPISRPTLCFLAMAEEGPEEKRRLDCGKVLELGPFSTFKVGMAEDRKFNNFGGRRTNQSCDGFWKLASIRARYSCFERCWEVFPGAPVGRWCWTTTSRRRHWGWHDSDARGRSDPDRTSNTCSSTITTSTTFSATTNTTNNNQHSADHTWTSPTQHTQPNIPTNTGISTLWATTKNTNPA